jgi:hypothetical protein
VPLYLHLCHGRTDPTDVRSDWGANGPTLGPFDALHVVYLSAIELHRGEVELTLTVRDGLVCFDDVFYGDYEVLSEPMGRPLPLEDASTVVATRATNSLLARCAPLAHVFLDAIRTHHGDELARRVETLLRAGAA